MTFFVELEAKIADSLLEIGAITLRPKQPFTWTSGIKSPIYCDNRLTMSYPEIRKKIAEGFASIMRSQFADAEVIAGTATAGIPHAAWLADLLGLPMIYIRSKAKGHGKENQIEGVLKPGQKVVVIEDLISTGGSSLKAASVVNEAGGHTLGVIAIFTYQLAKAKEAFEAENMPLYTLSNYTALLEEAVLLGKVQKDELDLLKSWQENPAGYSMAFK